MNASLALSATATFLVSLTVTHLVILLFKNYPPSFSPWAFLEFPFVLFEKGYARLFPAHFLKHLVFTPDIFDKELSILLGQEPFFSIWNKVEKRLRNIESVRNNLPGCEEGVSVDGLANFVLSATYRLYEALFSEIVREVTIQLSRFPEYLRVPLDSMKQELYEDAMTFLVARLEIPGYRRNKGTGESGLCSDKDFFHDKAEYTMNSPAKRVRHD